MRDADSMQSNPGGTGLEQSPSDRSDGCGDSGLTPGGAGGGRAPGVPIFECADEPKRRAAYKLAQRVIEKTFQPNAVERHLNREDVMAIVIVAFEQGADWDSLLHGDYR